jgi:hypothetical protein
VFSVPIVTHGCDGEAEAFSLLKVSQDFEEVAGLRVAARAEHAHQALRRLVDGGGKFVEALRGVDLVAQHRLAGVDVAGEERGDLGQESRLYRFP